jgi:hypothetical protein
METFAPHDATKGAALRRAFAARFTHKFEPLPNRAGLMETQSFHGKFVRLANF